MKLPLKLSRRTVLRGLGTAVALPVLDAMFPLRAFAGRVEPSWPNRMAFLYVPNGAHMAAWTPEAEGTEFVLPETLEPLAPFKHDMLVLTGLTQDNGRAKGDGPGDHARAMSSFLTGAHPRKTAGADIKVGVSVDQFAAQKIGSKTRFPSLEIGCDRGAMAGNCDSGYSCAYSANLAWKTESEPVAKEVNPKLVFERLFTNGSGESSEAKAKRDRYNKSILDFVREDADSLKSKLGANDQRKLDEYLTSVREIEVRIARADQEIARLTDGFPRPTGVPKDNAEHIRIMADLLVLAFQGDVTRIATFVFANEGSNKSYSFIGVSEGHHDLSHHGGDEDKHAKIKKINRFHTTQFAYLLEKMRAVKEGDGTLLDHAMVVYGSGLGDGNRHNHDDLPSLLAGRGAGTLSPGRHVKHSQNTPLNNLFLSMLDRMNCPADSIGDSKGRLPDLTV